jgi:two-component system cell cycle sensor histidine kinase/response regulator CckA
MDETTKQCLFDPFFTTKTTGRGLGMSAILGIVRSHKGSIFVDSTLGKATSIRVAFPIQDGADNEKPASQSSDGLAAPSNAELLTRGLILIVDDEDFVRTVCANMVRKIGWSVLTASDGPEAIALLRQKADDIACVILDLSMPHMDGIATFHELRSIKKNLQIILSSGYSSDQESVQQLTEEGVAGFIQKPYDILALGRAIAHVLGKT